MENSIQGEKLHPSTNKKITKQENQKEERHTDTILLLKAKIAGNSNHYSLISININGLNSPIKRHRLSDWIHKQNPAFWYIQETYHKDKSRHYLRVKGWGKTFQANGHKKQAGMPI